MVTRRDDTVDKNEAAPSKKRAPAKKAAPVPRKQPAAKKVAARTGSTPSPASAAASAAEQPQGLLRAGLKAFGTVRDDVVKRQSNVFESLLGIGKSEPAGGTNTPARGFAALEPFGIRKFEEVFDQRVATSLQRLGIPSAQEVQELREQVKLLLEQVQRLESERRKR